MGDAKGASKEFELLPNKTKKKMLPTTINKL